MRSFFDGKRAAGKVDGSRPIPLILKKQSKIHIWLAQMRRFGNGAVKPDRGEIVAPQLAIAAGDEAQGRATLVRPR